jgi:hypothetical protein
LTMRQRQRDSSCGVETAATCTRLPPIHAPAHLQRSGEELLHL